MTDLQPVVVRSDEFNAIPWRTGDLLVFPIGYEKRSIYVAKSIAGSGVELIGAEFTTRRVLSFSENLAWVREQEVTSEPVDDVNFATWFERILPRSSGARLAVDISSFSRDRIAAMCNIGVKWLRSPIPSSTRTLTFLYAPGEFDVRASNNEMGPFGEAQLLDRYVGAMTDPDLPLTLIVGLGLEASRAVGIIELLEPDNVTALVPSGSDPRFLEEVARCNKAIMDRATRTAPFLYDVMRPAFLVDELTRRTRGLSGIGRAVFVPLGPKIFALACCLSSELGPERIPIWRLTGGQLSDPLECAADGSVAAITLSVGAPSENRLA